MGHKYAEIAFTQTARDIQTAMGSRESYQRMELGEDYNHQLRVREIEFISARDSFYIATVSETGWPYLQHRGGLKGFVKVLNDRSIGFADYSGNRQYLSRANLMTNPRVALFFMDYLNRRRLKILGRVERVDLNEPEKLSILEDKSYQANIEQGMIIHIEAFDWNCPQHITQRFTEKEIESRIAPLEQENRRLTERLNRLERDL